MEKWGGGGGGGRERQGGGGGGAKLNQLRQTSGQFDGALFRSVPGFDDDGTDSFLLSLSLSTSSSLNSFFLFLF